MRFFLHKAHANLTKVAAASRLSSETQLTLNESASKMVLWGQQCSPTCGCAIRFEIKVDDRDRILSASYCAKTVLTTTTQAKDTRESEPHYYLKPVRTTRTNRPMLKECKCQTVNTLAKEVVNALQQTPRLHLSTAQNMLECVGVRSSTATRAVSLSNLDCSPNDSHCYDVLEEALTACLKGYMPQSRVNDVRQQQQQYMQKNEVEEIGYVGDIHTDEPINPLRYVQAAKRAGKIFPSSSMKDASLSSMPAFHLHYSEEDKDGYSQSTTLKQLCNDFVNLEQGQRQSFPVTNSQESLSLDWQDYVDEKYELESSEN